MVRLRGKVGTPLHQMALESEAFMFMRLFSSHHGETPMRARRGTMCQGGTASQHGEALAKGTTSPHGETLTRRAFSSMLIALLTVVLSAGCLFGVSGCAAPDNGESAANAPVENQAGEFSVALTVVDTTDNNKVVYNGAVSGLTGEMTVIDLLEAAGFHEVATIEETANDDHAYTIINDSPYFLGKQYDEATGDFWVTMFDGSADDWESSMSYATLMADGHYQYIYGDGTSFAYGNGIDDPLS